MINVINDLFGHISPPNVIGDIINEAFQVLSSVPWLDLIKILVFLTLIVFHLALAFAINDRIFLYYAERLVREHHMTIKNNGNTPSVYLLHAVDLPKQLQIDFASGGAPMIYMTQKKKEAPPAEEKKAENTAAQPAAAPQPSGRQASGGKSSGEGGLIPDLSDPMKPVDTVRETATDVGQKAGLLASIIGTITSLLPIKSKTLDQGAQTLKGVQQGTMETVGTINNKINSADTLKRQVGSLGPKSDKEKGKDIAAASGRDDEKEEILRNRLADRLSDGKGPSDSVRDTTHLPDFIYDEKVWKKKVGKTDESGNSLIYAQTRVLEPGESMKIDLRLRNRSRNYDAISRMYKIEITQIPQTRMHLAVPRESVNGIVSFPQASALEQHIPPAVMVAEIILSALIIALFGKLIF